jgi:hypothetical protein
MPTRPVHHWTGGCISNDAHNGAHKNFKGNILISEMMGYAHVFMLSNGKKTYICS